MPRRKTVTDMNAAIADLLRGLAAIQPSRQKRWAYEKSADTIAALPASIETYLLPSGQLRKIPNVGPSSERVVLEVLRTGGSPTVEQALTQATSVKGEAFGLDATDAPRGTFLTRDEVAAALKDRKLKAIARREYRGDLQMHSTYSDGTQTLEMMVEVGLSRGYEYSAVTDHSYGLPVAHGVSMARLAKQHEEIDRLNEVYAGRYRMLKGIEANILADGLVDMTREERRKLEIVVAAPHSGLRSSGDQTQRMLKAVRTPGVHILGHPRGRKFGVRSGLAADWDRIFAAAAQATVAVEIDGDPRRQDIDHELARRALDAGCIFALDSDAHAPAEWAFADTAIAHARLAGIPSERVINCWPVSFLLEWAAGRQE